MTGIVGGTGPGAVDEVLAAAHEEPWYETERLDRGELGLALRHHGERDPGGHATWQGDRRAGVIFGATPGEDVGRVCQRVLDDPAGTLPSLDGPFLVATVDAAADRVVVATDKLGTRPCYYLTEPGFAVASSASSLLALVDDPQVDRRGVSDMLMIGHVWGEKTLVEDVSYLPSGSVLEYDDGDVTVDRYWTHQFGQRQDPGYVPELVDSYRTAIEDMSSTLESETALWLSGGLDSRAMAGELSRHRPITGLTYDANPAGGGNLDLARRVSDCLEIENEQVPLGPDGFVDAFEDCVTLTDGMIGLMTFVNISAVFSVPDDIEAGVIIEACGQGGMMGDGIKGSTISRANSPEDALYRAKHLTDVDTVRRLLDSDFDPLSTYRVEVGRSDQAGDYATVMDCYYRNYFPRGDFGSNPIPRSQVGTRVPFAHGGFLDRMTKLPVGYRTRTFPYTEIPMGTSRMKLELVRHLNRGLEDIPYERTTLPPTRPEWQQGLGFVGRVVRDRLRRQVTYGGRGMTSEWYRTHDGFGSLIDGLLDDAVDRPYLDGAEIQRLRRDHRNRDGDHMGALSSIATVECWLQAHVDD